MCMMHAFQQQSHEIHAHGGSHKPPCASSAHRRRFQKAKAFGGGGAQHRHPSPPPFGKGSGGRAVTAEPPPCASSAHRKRLQKAEAFGGGGAQHRHPSPPPFGSRGSHGRAAPLCIFRSQKTVAKGGSLWRRRCAAPPSIAPSLREGVGGRAVTAGPPCAVCRTKSFSTCAVFTKYKKSQKTLKNLLTFHKSRGIIESR